MADLYDKNELTIKKEIVCLSISPNRLGPNLMDTITMELGERYMGKINKTNGYILQLDDIKLIDNKIGEKGYIYFSVSMTVISILPRPGLQYNCTVKTVLPEGCITDNPHFQSLIIGGTLINSVYRFKCGCSIEKNAQVVAVIDFTVFSQGKHTCICSHKCPIT